MSLAKINMIWIGNQLGNIHTACIRSFLRHGHNVKLHVYTPPEDTPNGVQLCDANKLIPKSYIFQNNRTGSYAPFKDLLSYRVIEMGHGMIMDCDFYCLKPIIDKEYIISGEIRKGVINIAPAAIKLPKNTTFLRELNCIIYNPDYIPPWEPLRRRIKYKIIRQYEQASHSQLSYGALGSGALSYYIKKYKLLSHLQPKELFYPVDWRETYKLFDTQLNIDDIITSKTIALHLNHLILKDIIKNIKVIPNNCPLHYIINN